MSAGTWILVRRGRSSQLPSHFPSPKLSISLLEKVTLALRANITSEVAVLMITGMIHQHQHKAEGQQGRLGSSGVRGGTNPSLGRSRALYLCPLHMLVSSVTHQPPAGVRNVVKPFEATLLALWPNLSSQILSFLASQ